MQKESSPVLYSTDRHRSDLTVVERLYFQNLRSALDSALEEHTVLRGVKIMPR